MEKPHIEWISFGNWSGWWCHGEHVHCYSSGVREAYQGWLDHRKEIAMTDKTPDTPPSRRYVRPRPVQ